MEMNEKDQIIFWALSNKNPHLRKYVNEQMPTWIHLINKVRENPNYLYQCNVGINDKLKIPYTSKYAVDFAYV
jgi:hypothetical protein